jgi:hypothetical protein
LDPGRTTQQDKSRKEKETHIMRIFWSIFFLGSMLLIGLDVRKQADAQQDKASSQLVPGGPTAADATGFPTP